MVDQSKIASIIGWLIAGAQPPKSIEDITQECAKRLIEAGVQIDAFIVNGLFIHPHIRGIQIKWTARNGVRRVTFAHEFFEVDFLSTPIAISIESRRMLRYRSSDNSFDHSSPYAKAFVKEGFTDLVVLPLFNFDGTVTGCVEIGTCAETGFDDDQITALRRIQAPLARMKEYFTERFDKQITLATYVGEETSRKVLSGKIVLGDGEMISAVVLFADIKGFTRLSNALPSGEVLQLLNRFYAAVDTVVSHNNGEILKFMGDGVLAIFPTPDDLTAQESAASGALGSVALARAELAKQGADPALEFRASLHIGDVFFGNIGSGSRLDFTAIGPSVNLGSRMLAEASKLDVETICSKEFKDLEIGMKTRAIECQFRGFDAPTEVFMLE